MGSPMIAVYTVTSTTALTQAPWDITATYDNWAAPEEVLRIYPCAPRQRPSYGARFWQKVEKAERARATMRRFLEALTPEDRRERRPHVRYRQPRATRPDLVHQKRCPNRAPRRQPLKV